MNNFLHDWVVKNESTFIPNENNNEFYEYLCIPIIPDDNFPNEYYEIYITKIGEFINNNVVYKRSFRRLPIEVWDEKGFRKNFDAKGLNQMVIKLTDSFDSEKKQNLIDLVYNALNQEIYLEEKHLVINYHNLPTIFEKLIELQ